MLLLHLSDVNEANWAEKLKVALAPYPVVRRGDEFDPAAVEYIFVWKPKPEAFEGLSGLKAILSLGSWSRTPKDVDGVEGFAGAETFDAFLAGTDILVNLLPLTPETTGILNYETFSKLRRDRLDGGPVIVNAARGGHQREADIVKALGDGTLGAASLDVFEVEPLPADSPLWAIENCYITPHIAAISNVTTGVSYFSQIIRDHEAGKPLINVVDRSRGY
jgi:glyoxylate/hydroxypyruvate reductase